MNRNELPNDPEMTMRLVLDGRQALMWTAMPAIVQSVNLSQMTVEIQPAIQGVITLQDNSLQYVNLPLLVDVPICFPKAGGFVLTFPIAPGDEVLAIIASRCIDSWWQSGGIGQPIELRMHDLSDGFAIPGPSSLPNVISNISATDVQLRNQAGTTYLSIRPDGSIGIVSPIGISIMGNVIVTGELTANGIPLSTHLHGGVASGPDDTGGPIP